RGLTAGFVAVVGGCLPGQAFGSPPGPITFSSGPGTGPAPPSLGQYVMQPFSSSGSGATVSSVAAPTGQVGVSPSMSDQPGPYTNGTSNFLVSNGLVTEETFTLPPGTGAFYVYAGWECNCGGGGGPPPPVSITATAQDGTSSGPVSVALGAPSYFGFYAACGSSVQTVELSVTGQQWTLTDGAFGIAPATCSGTQVGCNYQFATLNDVCTATVSSGTSVSPTGTVAFTAAGGGVFTAGSTCALASVAASPGIANCSVTYVPPATGSPRVTASYGGDANNPASSATTNALIPQNVAVVIANATISPSAFIAALTGPPASSARALGAIVHFKLKAPAVVRFTVQRPELGRKATKGVCQRVSKRNARRAHCTRWVTLHGRFTRKPQVGTNKFRFRGRIGGRTLSPGRYHLLGTPSIAGVAQKRVVIPFRVK
ncbi:MAG: hypothetical protein QOI98_1594, partial [Solirubrobacteraceae bacterium]|nr:hypothetical protein [Solirubrobacteraceae bacterium]